MASSLAPAAVGFRSHTGWAAAVCLGGPAFDPAVLDRRRLSLTDDSLPFEPYHAARSLDGSAAEQLIARAAAIARLHATEGIRSIIRDLQACGNELATAAVILSSGRADFTLSQALSSHGATHNAEGWLYRDAIARAAEDCGLHVLGIAERNAYGEAARALGIPASALEQRLKELGRALGPPWGGEQKRCAAAAWLALSLAAKA